MLSPISNHNLETITLDTIEEKENLNYILKF